MKANKHTVKFHLPCDLKKPYSKLGYGLLITVLTVPSLSMAAENNCAPDLIAAPQTIPAKADVNRNQSKYIEADSLTQPSEQVYELQGNTVLTQPGIVVLSDKIRYDQQQQKTNLDGNIELHQAEITITADHAEIDDKNRTAELKKARYQLLPSRTHGKSNSIEINETKQRATLNRASLTTCKIDKDGSKDWDLKFDVLEVNEKTRRVVGKNTTFYIKDVPVFYTPYFDYPLDNRASGLLFPEFGSYKSIVDDSRHQFAKIPYYFNIAENMDDTLSLIPISQRGLAVDNEFRYMQNSKGILHSAELTVTALQDKIVASDGLTTFNEDGDLIPGDKDADRWRVKLKANQQWTPSLSSSFSWQEVSDEIFFKQIPVEENLKNASYQQRYARLDYRVGNLHAHARILSYMKLLNFADNYEKRPELGLTYFKDVGPLQFDVAADVSDFYVPVSNHTRPEGMRFHIEPQLTHRWQNSYAYLTTTAKAYLSQYQMVDNSYNPSDDTQFARAIPQLAVRGGLIFEKDLSLLGKKLKQTLEPEVQFLETPYLDQSDIALFDTTNRSLAFENLFALNRFTGADRIGDTRQLSMAVTSRIYQDNGKPLAEAGIGQIYYLKDRKVQLDNTTVATDEFSDVFVKLGLTLDNWYLSSNTQYDPQALKLTNSNSRIKWQNQNHLLMLNHSIYDVDTVNEIDMLSVGINSKINNRWSLGYYSSYNLQDESIYETQLNLSYNSCCWSAEILAERTQLTNGLYNDAIRFQFELKGLSTSNNGFRDDLTDKLIF